MIPLLPIAPGPFRMSLGVQALGDAPVVIVDPDRRPGELRLRERLLHEDHAYRYRGGPATHGTQWEVLALLLRDLARHHPADATLREDGTSWTWTSRALGDDVALRWGDAADLPCEPLDWVGRRVVEDLVVLSGDAAAGFPVIAGRLCFPNGWALPDTIGRPVVAVHDPVPGFAREVGDATWRLLSRLRPGRPVWRANWAVRATDALDLSPRTPRVPTGHVDAANAGTTLFVRVERQTLTRLPSGAILFTIHTRSRPLGEVVADPGRAARLREALASMPPAMADYKGLTPVLAALTAHLAALPA